MDWEGKLHIGNRSHVLTEPCRNVFAPASRRGYLLTQVAGGVWADKFGGKPILGFGVVWWSVATVLTPFAAQLGLPVGLALCQPLCLCTAAAKA